MIDDRDEQRLEPAANIWLATVRPNGTPHLIPIWFVWENSKVYLCTSGSSVKSRNIRANPHISLALEDGTNPLVIEGKATILETMPDEVAAAFQSKYHWDIRTESTDQVVIEITPTRKLI